MVSYTTGQCDWYERCRNDWLGNAVSSSKHMWKIAEYHYNDVKMGAMASQITSLTIVYSIVYSRRRWRKASKLRVPGFCVGNSPMTGEFTTQMASYAKNCRFDHVIIQVCDLKRHLGNFKNWCFQLFTTRIAAVKYKHKYDFIEQEYLCIQIVQLSLW